MARTRAQRRLAGLLAETRRLLRRARSLDPHARAELEAVRAMAEAALASGDASRIDAASRALDEAATRHVLRFRKSVLREAAEVVAVAVVLAILVRLFVVEAFRIPSASMVPTLLPGDVVLVSKSAYGLRLPGGLALLEGEGPRRGDVVVFESPRRPGERLIKRVAGVAGDTVELVDAQVIVNGEPQPRAPVEERWEYWSVADGLRYWHAQSGARWIEELGGVRHAVLHSRLLPAERPREGPFAVPEGHVFVLGDNRDESDDGRAEGGWYVPVASVKGKAVLIGASWGKGGLPLLGDAGPRLARLLLPLDQLPEAETLEEAAAALRGAGEER